MSEGGIVEIRLETDINATAERIFAILVDLRGYGRWLTPSQAYGGTVDVSSDPIALGTTYTEPGPTGVRHGKVTEFRPPSSVGFRQPMTMRPGFLGTIDIEVSLTLTPRADAVRVLRVVHLTAPGPLKLVQPVIVREFRRESGRMLAALKAFAERPGSG